MNRNQNDAIKVYSGDMDQKALIASNRFIKSPNAQENEALTETQQQKRLKQIEEERRNYYETELIKFVQSKIVSTFNKVSLQVFANNKCYLKSYSISNNAVSKQTDRYSREQRSIDLLGKLSES